MSETKRGQRLHTVATIKTITIRITINTWAIVQLDLVAPDEPNHPTSEVKLALPKRGSKDKPLELQP